MVNPKLGDVGTAIDITVVETDPTDANATVPVDISAASLLNMKFLRPDQTGFTRTAVFKTDGTDGIVRYTTIANDLDQAGTWKVEVYLEMGGGSWHTDTYKMKVDNVLAGA